eukprot:CAMPEP_0119336630 /NCGR_PEP_ID=MMETSP1333-20130426/92237_1 /TAXON_ID=418940 /ORGANISM="Scyphosphaera apsteinii, Strain RCC1455" /LENGTH=477 /DNA_ID=CAMNT_0007347473 /DNA_START=16 /DNA_END=1449 /DNA_ORIENTATION=+
MSYHLGHPGGNIPDLQQLVKVTLSALSPEQAVNVRSGASYKAELQEAIDAISSLPPDLMHLWCQVYSEDFDRFGYDQPKFCMPLQPVSSSKGVEAIVQTYNHKPSAPILAMYLRKSTKIKALTVVDDGSVDGSGELWDKLLTSMPHAIDARALHTDNLHEIRAYNHAAKIKRGASRTSADVLCFFQDDDMPEDAAALDDFLEDVLTVMNRFRSERLGIVSGRATSLCGVEFGPQPVDHALKSKRKQITFQIAYERNASRPFMFVSEAWLAPMCVRRDVFNWVGGFDESLSGKGEPGVGLDIHLSIQSYLKWHVLSGLTHSRFIQGYGGHASVSSARATALRRRLRDQNSARASNLVGCKHGRWPGYLSSAVMSHNKCILKQKKQGKRALSAVEDACQAAAKACLQPAVFRVAAAKELRPWAEKTKIPMKKHAVGPPSLVLDSAALTEVKLSRDFTEVKFDLAAAVWVSNIISSFEGN